jgi:hypothetical protein
MLLSAFDNRRAAMRIVVSKRDAGFTEAVAPLDWELDVELLSGGPSRDADTTAIAEVWARRATRANGVGASETIELG